MGFMSANLCSMCQGTGKVVITDLNAAVLFEWIEGYFDDETPDEWLETVMQKLIDLRKAKRR